MVALLAQSVINLRADALFVPVRRNMVKADIRIAAKRAAKAGETAASIVRDFAWQQTADCNTSPW